jgi:serine/threonine protein kinase/tetratricopeptide (TPR) repeat protein
MNGDQAAKHRDTTPRASIQPPRGAPPSTIGDFRVVRTLGRGGMAVVYFAEHAVTGERVAIKTVESAEASLLSGLRREIHALRRVDHPGVVRIVAEGVEGGLPWYAMEVIDGRTLHEYTADLAEAANRGAAALPTMAAPTRIRGLDTPIRTPTPCFERAANGVLPEVLTVLRRVCDALAFVHGMGIVHLDLKPENVMVRDDGSPVLVDFGLAMQLRGARGRDVLELGQRFVGTPGYMAPEQIDGELMDARVDLYALGCMMYECVTGTVPFLGSVDQVFDQQVHSTPERPSARVSEVPPALDDLILALLRKRPRDRIGYADDVAAALVRLGAGDSPPARRIEPHLYRPRLAGRAPALATLEEKLEGVLAGRGARVLVGGESGVGKTRFAMEVGRLASRRGLAIATGQCISVAASDAEVKATSLHPLLHLLSTIADHCREQGLSEAERVFGPRGAALAAHEPSIATLPGQEAHPRLADLPAPAARARLNGCLAGVLAAYADPAPLVLVLEDLQWADEATMSFLQSLDEGYFSTTRVLLLGTYRAEETGEELGALLRAPDVTRVDLGRLDAHAVQRMVSDMISVPTPPASFLRFLVERSEGHPFFVAEYVRIAVQERMLFRNDTGEWQFQRLAANDPSRYDALPLPGELRALVIRRVAALGAGALSAARMASVLGREIDAGVLAAAMSLDDTGHLEAVEELRARQIIEIDPGGRLRFAHDKLREIIHGEIDADERSRLHAAAGAAIEATVAGAALAGSYPELVHHFTMARDQEKAFEYLIKAGQAALDATASGEALLFFRRALAIDDARAGRGAAPLGQIERARLESRIGQAAFNVGLLPEAERLTRAALHRFRGERVKARSSRIGVVADFALQIVPQAIHLLTPDRPVVTDPIERQRLGGAAQAAQRLTEIHFFQQEWVRGLGTALQTVSVAGRLGVSLELVRGYVTIGFGLTAVRLPRLRALYEARAREAATALDDAQGAGLVALLTGVSALIAGRWTEARASIDIALGHARGIQDPRQIEMCLGILTMIERHIGRPEDALTLYDQLAAVGQKNGSDQCQIWALGGQAECALALGHVEKAIALFEQRRAFAIDYRNDPSEWIVHGALSEAYLVLGDHERARRAAEETLGHLEKLRVVGFRFYRGLVSTGETFFALWERATSAGDRMDLSKSARRVHRKMQRYAALYAIGRPQALRLQGLLEARSGRTARAHAAFRESVVEARRLSMPLEEGIAHYELGRHRSRSDPARESHFVAARAIFAGLGQRWWLDRLEHASARSAAEGL